MKVQKPIEKWISWQKYMVTGTCLSPGRGEVEEGGSGAAAGPVSLSGYTCSDHQSLYDTPLFSLHQHPAVPDWGPSIQHTGLWETFSI